MDELKVTCMILVALSVCQSVLGETLIDGDGSKKSVLRVSHYARVVEIEKGKVSSVRYEVCYKYCDIFGNCKVYYCPGDTICCTPGSPTSKCCPADHPVCLSRGCCSTGYRKICGPFCCHSDTFCCNDENCCKDENTCCGKQECCSKEAPCCKENKKKTCCNKDSMACCDGYGCVEPCESQFDAVGCELRVNGVAEEKERVPLSDLTGKYSFGEKLYRVVRPDEDCMTGLVAKNPLAEKTVLSHVNCGSKNNYKSQFISTTTSLEVAKYYKKRSEEKGKTGIRIAEIPTDQLPMFCKIVDLTIEANRDIHLGNAVCKNFAKYSCEVLLDCTKAIPCKVIEDEGKENRKDFSEL